VKEFKQAIVDQFLETVTFSEIAIRLKNLTPDQKDAFVRLCVEGSNQLGGRLKGICLDIAKEKAQVKIDQIMTDGTIAVSDLNKILSFIK